MDGTEEDIEVTKTSPKNPLEHYRSLRERLFDSQGEEKSLFSLMSLFAAPYAKNFQPSRALERLFYPSYSLAPLVPIQYPSGAAPLTDWWGNPEDQFPRVAENCQLALLWSLIGVKERSQLLQEASNRLAAWLKPIVASGLWTLWSTENSYEMDDTKVSVELFLRALGENPTMEKPDHPFFAWIYEQNPQLSCSKCTADDPSLGYQLHGDLKSSLAISASGKRTGAGALKVGSWSILAFGPQGDPLSDANLFGLSSAGNPEGWFSSVAQPEAWFRAIPEKVEKGWVLKVDSVGLSAHRPLAFVFYATGDACSIHGRTFKPGSLQRYAGEGRDVLIDFCNEKFLISSGETMKLEVIPLAGDSGFWGASFLVAFWLSPFAGSYQFEIIAK